MEIQWNSKRVWTIQARILKNRASPTYKTDLCKRQGKNTQISGERWVEKEVKRKIQIDDEA